MIINIPTDERSFYRKALRLLEPFSPYNKLRKRELDVLAELYYFNNKLKSIDFDMRMDTIFSQTTRLDIIQYIDMSKDSLNNNLKELRKKGFILNNKLVEKCILKPEHATELIFRFQTKVDSSRD